MDALSTLKKYFSKTNSVEKIRNSFGFHFGYRQSDLINSVVDKNINNESWKNECHFYFSEHHTNTFFWLSEWVVTHTTFETIGCDDPIMGHRELVAEISSVLEDMANLSSALIKRFWHYYISEEMLCKDILDIEPVSAIDRVQIPFFVKVDS